jgi:hypothetical protein
VTLVVKKTAGTRLNKGFDFQTSFASFNWTSMATLLKATP